MVETISPVVHGGRTRSYWLSIGLHVLGATLAAAAFGAVLGGLGGLVGAPWEVAGVVVIVAAAALYFAREAFRLPLPTFDRKQQVPEWWRTFYSRPMASFLYGLGLGIGFATYLTFGTFVVVALAAFLSGHVGVGALLSGTFGAARSLAVAIAGDADTDAIADRMTQGRRLNAAALALVAAGALVTLI